MHVTSHAALALNTSCTQSHATTASNNININNNNTTLQSLSSSQAALALNILRGAYPPLRGYSAELMAIVDRCLCKRRAARPATDKLLLLPSVQRWAATLGIELPLVPQPRRATPSGGHTRAASWSPAADHHGAGAQPADIVLSLMFCSSVGTTEIRGIIIRWL